MEISKLQEFNPNSKDNDGNKSKSSWYLSCGLLFLFFFGLITILGIIFTIFGKIIIAMFLTN